MSLRDAKLDAWKRHKSPRGVAQHMRGDGVFVGKQYETHGSVWDESNDVLTVGLLHLVVDELQAIKSTLRKKPVDMMAGHSAWLFRFHDRAVKAVARHSKECQRISQFCDLSLLRSDIGGFSVLDLSKRFRRDFGSGQWDATNNRGQLYRHRELILIESRAKRLRSVKSIHDIENLNGIGKKTADKIRKQVNQMESKK